MLLDSITIPFLLKRESSESRDYHSTSIHVTDIGCDTRSVDNIIEMED